MKCFIARLFCFHDFIRKKYIVQKVYSSFEKSIPMKIQTSILFECKKCGKMHIEKIDGEWNLNE